MVRTSKGATTSLSSKCDKDTGSVCQAIQHSSRSIVIYVCFVVFVSSLTLSPHLRFVIITEYVYYANIIKYSKTRAINKHGHTHRGDHIIHVHVVFVFAIFLSPGCCCPPPRTEEIIINSTQYGSRNNRESNVNDKLSVSIDTTTTTVVSVEVVSGGQQVLFAITTTTTGRGVSQVSLGVTIVDGIVDQLVLVGKHQVGPFLLGRLSILLAMSTPVVTLDVCPLRVFLLRLLVGHQFFTGHEDI